MTKIIFILKFLLWLFYDLPITIYSKSSKFLQFIFRVLKIMNTGANILENYAKIANMKASLVLENQQAATLLEEKYNILEFKVAFKNLESQSNLDRWTSSKLATEQQILIDEFAPFKIKEVKIYLEKQSWFVVPKP